MNRREPTWQPVSRLALIASLIDAGLVGAREQHELLLGARHRPHLIDAGTLGRINGLFARMRSDVDYYDEQIARWKKEPLTSVQRREVERLTDALYELRRVVDAVVVLARESSRGATKQTPDRDNVEED